MTIEGLRLFQWGRETTRGTAVPATSIIAVQDIDFAPEDEVVRPKLRKGLLHRNPGGEVVVKRGTTFSVAEGPVVFRQLQHWLSMSVRGGVTAVGATAPYTWTFTRSLTADPSPDSWTFERRLSDGATSKDNRWSYGLLSQIAFSFAENEALQFSAQGFARRIQASTLTPALTMPVTEIPPAALAKVYIDDTWAARGTTQVTGQVLGATFTFHTGFKPLMSLDARADLDFTTHILDPGEVGFELELVMLVAGQYDIEKAKAEAAALRAVRLEIVSGSDSLKLDMLAKHEKGSLFKIDTKDGQDIVTMSLVDSDDGTNMFEAVVVNQVNTYA